MSAAAHPVSRHERHRARAFGEVSRRAGIAGVLLGVAASAAAQEAWLPIEHPDRQSDWMVRVGPRALFNIRASMDPVTTPVTPGVYDDGYVLPDINNGATGETWNWGYDVDSQATGNMIRFSRLSEVPAAGSYSGEVGDGVHPGGEILFGLRLTEFATGAHPVQFGLECGYGFNRFAFTHSDRATGTARLDVAGHDLGGTVAPPAPYRGSADQAGPLLDLYPSISGTSFSTADATYSGEWETSLHTFKLGFWFTYPISHRFSTALSLGYVSVLADTQVTYQESVDFQNPGFADISPSTQSVGGDRDWYPGFYSDLRLAYALSDRLGVYVGGQFQFNDTISFQEAGRRYEMDLGCVLSVSAGVAYRF